MNYCHFNQGCLKQFPAGKWTGCSEDLNCDYKLQGKPTKYMEKNARLEKELETVKAEWSQCAFNCPAQRRHAKCASMAKAFKVLKGGK